MKIGTVNRHQFIIIIGYICSVMGIIILPGALSTILSLLFVFITICLGYAALKRGEKKVSTLIIIIPIIMSVFQNVYLGLGSQRLNSIYIQVLLSLHFLLFSSLTILNLKVLQKRSQWTFFLITVIMMYSFLLFIIYPTNVSSALSSIRNILSCMLIYCFGIVMNKNVEKKDYYGWIKSISWFVVIFGLFEWLVGLDVWRNIGIARLWQLKGMEVNLWGIPSNWYSSEIIGGHLIRRMVSSFADPVNLGTFLFAAFMIEWYRKERILTFALALCCIFTVSKGALLGFLVFLVVYVWQNKKYRVFVPIMALTSLFIGILFIQFSLSSSTGSIIAHINGFLNSFSVLVSHPLGLGVGNVGVLAGLFNNTLLDSTVSETGIGMIISQLGFLGLFVYIFFILKLSFVPKKWNYNQDNLQREKILYYSLLFSFVANMMFNEVALSPNSCGLYFIEIAFLNEKNKLLQ